MAWSFKRRVVDLGGWLDESLDRPGERLASPLRSAIADAHAGRSPAMSVHRTSNVPESVVNRAGYGPASTFPVEFDRRSNLVQEFQVIIRRHRNLNQRARQAEVARTRPSLIHGPAERVFHSWTPRFTIAMTRRRSELQATS
jgi:hypothetical protein